jgi:hypothetical protein
VAPERDYPLLVLEAGPIHGGLREEMMRFISAFVPLEFEAADKAKAWLETNVSAGILPLKTYLVFSEDEAELLGFFVIDEMDVRVAPEDVPIMQVRKAIDDPKAETQRAMKLVWIARSLSSDPGFGNELFEHALLLAWEAGGCALMVEPYDQETAERLWRKHFHMREPRGGTDDWTCLWHAVGEANQDWG